MPRDDDTVFDRRRSIEERLVPARREIAEHLMRNHSDIRVEWVQTGHDTILLHESQEIAARIREFWHNNNGGGGGFLEERQIRGGVNE